MHEGDVSGGIKELLPSYSGFVGGRKLRVLSPISEDVLED